ncbi:uncharacterized protein LOC131619565 [Vicia villosa]|uniref:uncharacterized protein LOC131619565 n=1 Tax=Vicia villosa TaxID=3911 RepID=UPI00273C0B23|nr:uncharacterized protein LOC131619565 [Vicia villosa]
MGRGRPKKAVPPPPPESTASASGIVTSPEKESSPVKTDKTPTTVQPTAKPVVNEERKLWVDVLNDNRNPAKGRSMRYIALKMANGVVEVEIAPEDVASELDFWASSLIMYVMGGDLSMNSVKTYMTKQWNFVQVPDMYYHKEGYFLLRFRSFTDRDEVMMRGPYTIRNMPLLLKEWSPEFKLKDDFLRTIPLWVKLPQLPLYLWGEMSLNKIGSVLGTPLVTDECTANRLRISYARILVEMDITRDLPNEITICDNEGMKMQQSVEYEWKPIYCVRCQRPGHNCDKPKTKVAQWKPKVKTPENPILEQSPQKPSAELIIKKGVKDDGTQPVQPDEWIAVNKSGIDRGKIPMVSTPPTRISCENGFDALQILQDLQVLQESGL